MNVSHLPPSYRGGLSRDGAWCVFQGGKGSRPAARQTWTREARRGGTRRGIKKIKRIELRKSERKKGREEDSSLWFLFIVSQGHSLLDRGLWPAHTHLLGTRWRERRISFDISSRPYPQRTSEQPLQLCRTFSEKGQSHTEFLTQ